MIVFKIAFAIMICLPIAALAYYLFERITEDVAYGSRRVALHEKKGLTGKFFKMVSVKIEKRRIKKEEKAAKAEAKAKEKAETKDKAKAKDKTKTKSKAKKKDKDKDKANG